MKRLLNNGIYDKAAALVRSLMPAHTLYCEPYFTEGEVFFHKQPSQGEVVNDRNKDIVNFYLTVRLYPKEFAFLMESTIYSDVLFDCADTLLHRRQQQGVDIWRAWAVWLKYNRRSVTREALASNVGSWLEEFTSCGQPRRLADHVHDRLQHACLLNRTPLDVIAEFDGPETFFYLHPRNAAEAEGLIPVIGNLKGKCIFYCSSRRAAEKVAAAGGLYKESDAAGNTVYLNFKRQKSLFEQ